MGIIRKRRAEVGGGLKAGGSGGGRKTEKNS